MRQVIYAYAKSIAKTKFIIYKVCAIVKLKITYTFYFSLVTLDLPLVIFSVTVTVYQSHCASILYMDTRNIKCISIKRELIPY